MTVLLDTVGLQPQDVVLTIVGSHVREPDQLVWSGGMVKILEDLDFTIGSARAALARLVNRNLLARSREGRLVYYAVTQRAHALLLEGDRRIFTFGRSDPAVDQWTVLWHAIPEHQRVSRSRFASRLRFLGFGSIQDATWVAARNREPELRLLLDELDIKPYVSVMVGHMPPEIPPVALVAQAWRLDDARKRYEAFLLAFGGFRKASNQRRLSAADAFKGRILMLHRFRSFPVIDPELSEGIDTLRNLRRQAIECFDDVYATLETKAAEHFWKTVEPKRRRRD